MEQKLKPTTIRALKYPITINAVHNLDSTLPRTLIKERCKKASIETYHVEKLQKTTKRHEFIELCCLIMKRVFLKPPNMIFYIPNAKYDKVIMYDGDTIQEITKKEMVDCACDVIYYIVDDIIIKNNLSQFHPFAFIRQNVTNNFKTISPILAKHMVDMLITHSCDIKTVWRHAGLI
jgi:hypothetical protein